MTTPPLTLGEAAARCDVSVATLRRRIKDGSIRARARQTERDPYLVDEAALVEYGLTVHPEVRPRSHSADLHTEPESSILAAENERLRADVAALRLERDTILSRMNRAEGELMATRRDFDTLAAGIAPALSALSERQVIEVQPLRGEPVERAEPPARRRWWHREPGVEQAG